MSYSCLKKNWLKNYLTNKITKIGLVFEFSPPQKAIKFFIFHKNHRSSMLKTTLIISHNNDCKKLKIYLLSDIYNFFLQQLKIFSYLKIKCHVWGFKKIFVSRFNPPIFYVCWIYNKKGRKIEAKTTKMTMKETGMLWDCWVNLNFRVCGFMNLLTHVVIFLILFLTN